MRPRRIRRGEHRVAPRSTLTKWMLQCGHGEFAVENNPAQLVLAQLVVASMRPRRIRRGERLLDRQTALYRLCFNAATANSPWRTGQPGGQFDAWDSFNAATANSPWRTRVGYTSPSGTTKASMRPRRIRRGELR